MNQKQMDELLQTCNLLGVSPFTLAGVQKGDKFILNGTDIELIFQVIYKHDVTIGGFSGSKAWSRQFIDHYFFNEVTPIEPYRNKLEDFNGPA